MNPRFVTSFFLRSFRGYHCAAETYRPSLSPAPSVEVSHPLPTHLKPSFRKASDNMMRSLLQGYRPVYKPHRLGCEVESLLLLGPSQRMCYYEGKLFGGYSTFLMDQILADCCKPPESIIADTGPAFTVNLNTSFVLPVPPTVPIFLRAWPDKIDGRKIFLKGCIQIPGKAPNEWVDAIQAEALFIRPKI
ncbi:hypothetical protein N7476_004710 [Penicillium atrosanguineum]|uniref:Thioesterase domain-containing protein n=1 Tax=Penicillium atrosanguineum TaxID=1132637 RepID=A0A9W9PZT0_9EURO|nr:hypothetical protein N7476_004710 [Penicillium atrosanguineum]